MPVSNFTPVKVERLFTKRRGLSFIVLFICLPASAPLVRYVGSLDSGPLFLLILKIHWTGHLVQTVIAFRNELARCPIPITCSQFTWWIVVILTALCNALSKKQAIVSGTGQICLQLFSPYKNLAGSWPNLPSLTVCCTQKRSLQASLDHGLRQPTEVVKVCFC